MNDPSYWKTHYVLHGDAEEIARHITLRTFASGHHRFELLSFERSATMPCLLISQGSGGHAYVFAELGYELYRRGYNVFIMPKHGGHTMGQLIDRHQAALSSVTRTFNHRLGIYAEGLGGYVAFYLALAHRPIKSLVCQNAPALLTDPTYHQALLRDTGPWAGAVQRRKILLPIGKVLVRVLPKMPISIWTYLDWQALIDTSAATHDLEQRLVVNGYLRDPDFDT